MYKSDKWYLGKKVNKWVINYYNDLYVVTESDISKCPLYICNT